MKVIIKIVCIFLMIMVLVQTVIFAEFLGAVQVIPSQIETSKGEEFKITFKFKCEHVDGFDVVSYTTIKYDKNILECKSIEKAGERNIDISLFDLNGEIYSDGPIKSGEEQAVFTICFKVKDIDELPKETIIMFKDMITTDGGEDVVFTNLGEKEVKVIINAEEIPQVDENPPISENEEQKEKKPEEENPPINENEEQEEQKPEEENPPINENEEQEEQKPEEENPPISENEKQEEKKPEEENPPINENEEQKEQKQEETSTPQINESKNQEEQKPEENSQINENVVQEDNQENVQNKEVKVTKIQGKTRNNNVNEIEKIQNVKTGANHSVIGIGIFLILLIGLAIKICVLRKKLK